MTDEQMRDLVKECGLDWQRGYMPLFDGDPTNRYAVLIEAVEAAERERCAKLCDVARDAVWPYHEPEVWNAARTVCENLAARIRGTVT